ncbi:MAG: hypothetical protein ACK5PB_21945 [Pirellula sp.]|jgi:hypothetical protein
MTAFFSKFSSAQDGGKVHGALWTFVMTPHDKKLSNRSGMFRVYGTQIYQRSDLNKPGFNKKVGSKTQIQAKRNKKGKIIGQEKTTIQFTDLQSDGGRHTGMSGTVEVIKSRFGEWSGRYIDQDGLHWDFKCSRKQE